MIKFLDLQKQYSSIKSEIDSAIREVIEGSAFIGGKHVDLFEKSFAVYQQAEHCVGVANGTDALEIALEALSLPKGSEVLVPANTFIATSEAVTRSGYKVVFCDCDAETYTLSVEDVAGRIGPQTRAIIAVHLYGQPCDMDKLVDLAHSHNLRIIEDCAQSHGAEYKGRKIGTFGDIGTFSFYPGKNLGAYGDAGALVTNDQHLAAKCRMIANHGRVEKYSHEFEGRNSRLDGLQAAILHVKLAHLEEWNQKRIRLAACYSRELKNCRNVVLPCCAASTKHVYHLYVIRAAERDRLRDYLAQHGIETGIHYPVALPKLPAYRYRKQAAEPMFANTSDRELLSLPIGDHLEEEQIRLVAEAIKSFYSSNCRDDKLQAPG